MFERFTDRARKILVLSQEFARDHNHSFIGTEHLLYGLVAEGSGAERGVSAKVLAEFEVTPEIVTEKILAIVGDGDTPFGGNPPFTPRAKKVLELGLREALQLGHSYIGTEHLLLGLMREGEGVGCAILLDVGLDLTKVKEAVMQKIEEYAPKPPPPKLWHERARTEYSLRTGGSSTVRILMTRHVDEKGQDHNGDDVPWRDIATFDSYNDAENVLQKLRRG